MKPTHKNLTAALKLKKLQLDMLNKHDEYLKALDALTGEMSKQSKLNLAIEDFPGDGFGVTVLQDENSLEEDFYLYDDVDDQSHTTLEHAIEVISQGKDIRVHCKFYF